MAAVVVFFSVTIASLFISSSSSSIHDINTQRVTGTEYCETIQFGYSGTKRPERWGSLNPNYKECSEGKLQSPINIETAKVVPDKNLLPLNRHCHPVNVTLSNDGFNVGLFYGQGAGMLILDGKNYSLHHMHWHSPSEHRLDGVQYDAELHIVHKSSDGNISVVATLYRYGLPDPLVSKIERELRELAKEPCSGHEEAHIAMGSFNTKQANRAPRKYYRYVGSLTTPPCSENVIWNIVAKVRTISKEQVEALKAPLPMEYKNNCRPLQPLNGRKIQLYDELAFNNNY